MSHAVRPARRKLVWAAACLLVMIGALVLLRRPLMAAAITSSLKMAGAGDVQFAVTEASPWGVQLENLGFNLRTQRFDARRVTIDRARWWQTSLGAVKVEGLRVPVTIDGSDTNPWAWATYSGGGGGGSAGDFAVPAEQLSVDGVLVVQAAGQPAQDLTIKFEAKLGANNRWTGSVDASAPGFVVQAEGDFDYPQQALGFRVTRGELDLAHWAGFIQSLIVLPGGRWELAGQLSATLTGSYANDKFAANGRVQLRDGRFVYPERNVTAESVQADFTFSDFDAVVSEPGTVTMRELRAGEIVAKNLEFELAFAGPDKIAVTRARLRAFGGTLSAEPFRFFPKNNELDATLIADAIVVEQVLALAKDVPAKATGLVDGRLPIRIDSGGLRLGTGYLELKPGAYAEVQFNASGLLTRGVAPSNPSYPTLKKVESGLLRLRLTELRLDIRPPNAPPGRSATIRLAGEPVDKDVKAPVNLNLNVNGPLEQLLNLGFDKRLSF
ncbi:MAG: hypothetical protein C0518_09985 [Opitutus sp.]|nr:hypothetical protein [Opitutus sp.]